MPVRRRYLVREPTGRFVELSSRQFDRADDGVAPIPAFAGRCVDLVSAVLVEEEGRPPHLAEVAFTKLYFDSSGFIDGAKRDRMVRLMLESCADRRGRATFPESPDTPEQRAGAARHLLACEFGWMPPPSLLSEVMMRLDLPVVAADPQRTVH